MLLKSIILNFSILMLFTTHQITAAPFTIIGSGLVKDQATGLVWQRANFNGLTNWTNAISSCKGNINIPGIGMRPWRLPSINELKSIVDTTKVSGPTIDTIAFTNSNGFYYWSSTSYAPISGHAWAVSFNNGHVDSYHKGLFGKGYTRCVAGP